jgi:hypothetical protein
VKKMVRFSPIYSDLVRWRKARRREGAKGEGRRGKGKAESAAQGAELQTSGRTLLFLYRFFTKIMFLSGKGVGVALARQGPPQENNGLKQFRGRSGAIPV